MLDPAKHTERKTRSRVFHFLCLVVAISQVDMRIKKALFTRLTSNVAIKATHETIQVCLAISLLIGAFPITTFVVLGSAWEGVTPKRSPINHLFWFPVRLYILIKYKLGFGPSPCPKPDQKREQMTTLYIPGVLYSGEMSAQEFIEHLIQTGKWHTLSEAERAAVTRSIS